MKKKKLDAAKDDGGDGFKNSYLPLALTLLLFIVNFILIINPFSNTSTSECDEQSNELEFNGCLADTAFKLILVDPEKSEQICGQIKDQTIRDACYYELVHTVLVNYHNKNKEEMLGFERLMTKLNLLCTKISQYSLKASCTSEIGRSFIFRTN